MNHHMLQHISPRKNLHMILNRTIYIHFYNQIRQLLSHKLHHFLSHKKEATACLLMEEQGKVLFYDIVVEKMLFV